MAGYTKLFASIVGSTIWREPNNVRLVWVTMLAMADQNGIVDVSVPGLADLARVTLPECQEALARLESPDEHSRSKEFDGRRIMPVDGGWWLVNHGKYRNKMSEEDRRERNAAYMRQYRSRNDSRKVTGLRVTEVEQAEAEASPDPKAEQKQKRSEARASVSLRSAAGQQSADRLPSGEDQKESPKKVDYTDSEQLTLCPTDLHERAESLGVLADLAGQLKVPVESLRVEARKYVEHFVIGGGVGEKGNRWMKRLRGQLLKRARAGELTPPGAIEHAAHRRAERATGEAPVFNALEVGRRINEQMKAENERRRASARALREANDGK